MEQILKRLAYAQINFLHVPLAGYSMTKVGKPRPHLTMTLEKLTKGRGAGAKPKKKNKHEVIQSSYFSVNWYYLAPRSLSHQLAE